jgi:serine/threonine-protein kinase mTOR
MQVTAVISDMKSDSSEKLWDGHINRRLFDLIHSNHNTDKLGGILAIGDLLPSLHVHMLLVLTPP